MAYTSVACGLHFLLNTVSLWPTPLWPAAYASYEYRAIVAYTSVACGLRFLLIPCHCGLHLCGLWPTLLIYTVPCGLLLSGLLPTLLIKYFAIVAYTSVACGLYFF